MYLLVLLVAFNSAITFHTSIGFNENVILIRVYIYLHIHIYALAGSLDGVRTAAESYFEKQWWVGTRAIIIIDVASHSDMTTCHYKHMMSQA